MEISSSEIPVLEKVRKCLIYSLLVIPFISSIGLNIGRRGLHRKYRSVNTSGHGFYRQHLVLIHHSQPLSNIVNTHVARFFIFWNIFMFYENLKLFNVLKKKKVLSWLCLNSNHYVVCSWCWINLLICAVALLWINQSKACQTLPQSISVFLLVEDAIGARHRLGAAQEMQHTANICTQFLGCQHPSGCLGNRLDEYL